MIHTFVELFTRDLGKLKAELQAYETEDKLWLVPDGISNSAGNLALHLTGNLNHFIGAVLGNTGYVRTREVEFSAKNIARETLIADLDKTGELIIVVLQGMDPAKLEELYPEEKWNQPITVGHLLMHLLTHLNYHLGQINYHRRLIN